MNEEYKVVMSRENTEGEDLNLALLHAVGGRNQSLVTELLQRGADIDARHCC